MRPNILFSDKFQDWCLYDKNGVACCTKKLDLVKGWLDKGYLDRSPYDKVIKLFDKLSQPQYVHKYWDLAKKYKFTVPSHPIYHVDGVGDNQKFYDFNTRWNFECPTHHPVPKEVAILGILLGKSRK